MNERETKPASSNGRLIAVSLVALALVIRLAPVFVSTEGPGRLPPVLAGLQALAGTAALVLATAMAWWLGGVWAGVVAAALLVFDPQQVTACSQDSPDVLMSLALAVMAAAGLKFVLACDLATRVALAACPPVGNTGSTGGQAASGTPEAKVADKKASWLWAAVAGAAMAAAAYLDWIVLGLAVLAGILAVARGRWRPVRGWLIGAAVLVVCLAPAVVRIGPSTLRADLGQRLDAGFAPDSGQWLARMGQHAGQMWTPVVPNAGRWTMPAAAGYASLVPAGLLALAGVWVLRRRPAVLVWLLVAPVGLTLVHMPFVTSDLARVPAMPLVAVLGGAGLASFLHR
jgi:hypothetical protein